MDVTTTSVEQSSFVRSAKGQKWLLATALSLTFLTTVSCSKQGPSKDQLLARANEALAAGQFVRAEKDFRAVLGVAPEDQVAIRQLAILYSDQGQFLQAFPLLKKSAELKPDDTDVQVKL